MLSIIVGVAMVAFGAQGSAQSSHGGRITGTVVDSEGASISDALVDVFRADSTAVVSSTTTKFDGEFTTETLGAGPYTLKVRRQGFRSGNVQGIIVRVGQTNSVGTIRLEFGGCDQPGVNCDYFGEFPPAPVSSSYFTASLNCEVEIARSVIVCDAKAHDSTDVWIMREGGHIFVVALNGTGLSKPNSSSDSQFSESRLQLDGLGLGDDFWVYTQHGLISHVFPVDDIPPTTKEIKLWQVTRKR